MAPKEQHLALSSGVGLAGFVVTNFWDYGISAMEDYKGDILEVVLKPQKTTAMHFLLGNFQDISEEIHGMSDHPEGMKAVYDHIVRTLDEINFEPELPKPDLDSCPNENGHFDCGCEEVIRKWMDYVSENSTKIDELIVHSAFQFVFQDRSFLHDFNFKLSQIVAEEIDWVKENFPESVTSRNRMRRKHFPVWLKLAVHYRDKGTCVICRCDLTGLVRMQNTIHIDHIIPLDLFGTNDPTNMQLLCADCNLTKGNRTTETSTVNVPFWNLD